MYLMGILLPNCGRSIGSLNTNANEYDRTTFKNIYMTHMYRGILVNYTDRVYIYIYVICNPNSILI